jgi:hypothetical protein
MSVGMFLAQLASTLNQLKSGTRLHVYYYITKLVYVYQAVLPLSPWEIIGFMICSGFWDVTQRVMFVGRRFGTPCQFSLLGQSDRREYWEGVGGERFIGKSVGGDLS